VPANFIVTEKQLRKPVRPEYFYVLITNPRKVIIKKLDLNDDYRELIFHGISSNSRKEYFNDWS
jgi:hypothetical protein